MPTLLFHAGAGAPGARSIRVLSALRQHGWDVTVAHLAEFEWSIRSLGLPSLPVPRPDTGPVERLAPRRVELAAQLAELDQRVDEAAAREQSLRASHGQVQSRIVTLVELVRDRRAAGRHSDAAAARADLEDAKARRSELGEQIARVNKERNARSYSRGGVLARQRVLDLVVRPLPPTAAEVAGNGPEAPAADIIADTVWAADLTALAALRMGWLAGQPRPVVVYDARSLGEDLAWAPPDSRARWRDILPCLVLLADVVVVGRATRSLALDRYAAGRTITLSDSTAYAPRANGVLRPIFGLDDRTPLAIHINRGADASLVDLLVATPWLHLGLVRAPEGDLAAIRQTAQARGVDDRLHATPFVPHEYVSSAIGDADVTVVCRDSTAPPPEVFDSLAAGVPVVAPAGSGAGDLVVAEGLGRALSDGTPSDGVLSGGALADAVRAVLDDADLRRRARARAQEFSSEDPEAIRQLLALMTASPRVA